MLAEPADIDRAGLARVLAAGWRIEAGQLDYLPVGFGSHHWRVCGLDGRRWFVCADEIARRAVLDRALGTALALRAAGLEFVHAPLPGGDGGVTAPWDRWVVSVYSFVDGRSHPYGDFPDDELRRAVLRALGRLHATTVRCGLPRVDDLTVPGRADLAGLTELAGRTPAVAWSSGPFAEPTRELLMAARPRLAGLWRRYDERVAAVESTVDGWVVTHGEPHPGNVLTTGTGLLLVDWDTLLVAPRERDLWRTLPWTPADRAAYALDASANMDAIDLYRRRWDLADICAFAADLHAPHVDDANTRLAWRCLRDYLAP